MCACASSLNMKENPTTNESEYPACDELSRYIPDVFSIRMESLEVCASIRHGQHALFFSFLFPDLFFSLLCDQHYATSKLCFFSCCLCASVSSLVVSFLFRFFLFEIVFLLNIFYRHMTFDYYHDSVANLGRLKIFYLI